MARTVVEIHLVAGVETQAERPHVTFESAAGVKHAVDAVCAKPLNRAGKRVEGGWTVVKAENEASALRGDERLDASVAERQLGAEHAVENAEVRASQTDGAGTRIGESFGEDLVEVICGFRFEFDAVKKAETDAPTDSGEVCRCFRLAEVVGEDTSLDMIAFLSEGNRNSECNEYGQKKKSFHSSLQKWDQSNRKKRAFAGGLDGAGKGRALFLLRCLAEVEGMLAWVCGLPW